MSELSARLGLHAAVDRVASSSREGLEAAAAVIPVYGLDLEDSVLAREGTVTAGWSDGLEDLFRDGGTTGNTAPVIPDVEAALAEMAALDSPTDLEAAQRLRAIWALVQVVPDAAEDDALRGALRPAPAPGAPGADPLGELLGSLRSPASARAGHWDDVVDELESGDLVRSSVALLARTGCEDWVTWSPRDDGKLGARRPHRVAVSTPSTSGPSPSPTSRTCSSRRGGRRACRRSGAG